jgi:predicted molibdopterin-dependent oxidoreductase YjgC
VNPESKLDAQVSLTIDGKKVAASTKTTILEAARSIGIEIPTLCYHARLTPIGSCRVCVVEVDGCDAPVASCATPVNDGMVVRTESPELTRMRREAVQFLLLNHPLECPVCDKAGECELQDITYKLGVDHQDFQTEPQVWDNDNDSPLIFRSDGRCIRCGRCVAICNEVQDVGAIDFTDRGYDARIHPTNGDTLDCEFCGQCVSVCPVGALLPKTFLHRSRVWDLSENDTVCAFCGAGCSISAHTRNGKVYRVVSDCETTHNRGDLCSRGTFGFGFVEGDKRQVSARVKNDQGFSEADTASTLQEAATKFAAIAKEHGPQSVAAIGSARMTNEDAAAFSQFVRKVIGSPNLDTESGLGYRQLHNLAFGGPVGTFDDLEDCDSILVFGSDLAVEMPVPSLRIISAAKTNDARVVTAAPFKTKLHRSSRGPLVNAPGGEAALAMALTAIAIENTWLPGELDGQAISAGDPVALCARAGLSLEEVTAAAKSFFTGEHRGIVVGPYCYHNLEARNAIALLSKLTEPRVFLVSADRANMQGVGDVGCAPGEGGLEYMEIAEAISSGQIKALWVAGSDPASLFASWSSALDKLDLLIVQDPFLSRTAEGADYYLPTETWGQKAGAYTSAEGRVQMLGRFLSAPNDLLSDAEVFAAAATVLGVRLGSTAVPGSQDQTKLQAPKLDGPGVKDGSFYLVRGSSLYFNGTMTAHCAPLRTVCPAAYLALSPDKAGALKVESGAKVRVETGYGALFVEVKTDAAIPENVGVLVDPYAAPGSAAVFGTSLDWTEAAIKKAD